MLTTESEALEKWCPMMRQPFTQNYGHSFAAAAVNTGPAGQRVNSPLNRCIGTHCMMWRWAEKAEGLAERTGRSVAARRGYCGLAGADHRSID